MALLSALTHAIADAEGLEENHVLWIARHLREAGLISQAGRGRGAAHMTVSDATNLLIGVNGCDSAKKAVEAVQSLRSIELGIGPKCESKGETLCDLCTDGRTFGEAIERLISASVAEKGKMSVLDTELTEDAASNSKNTLEIGFGRPMNAAFISVLRSGPPNPTNPFELVQSFRSVVFVHYWDRHNLWSQDIRRKQLTVIRQDVLDKIGRLLAS